MNIRLEKMTIPLARAYFSKFKMDPALYMDPNEFEPYVYTPEKSDAVFERHRQLGRVYLAVMENDEPIGEIILKKIDREQKHCTLGICIRSDEYKNKGYGTQAEMLAVQYAFRNLDLETVFADTLIRNTRSQHVLQKVGFRETHRDESFVYFKCDKTSWINPEACGKA